MFRSSMSESDQDNSMLLERVRKCTLQLMDVHISQIVTPTINYRVDITIALKGVVECKIVFRSRCVCVCVCDVYTFFYKGNPACPI